METIYLWARRIYLAGHGLQIRASGGQISSQHIIDIDLSPGIYLVIVEIEDIIRYEKLVVTN